jgi:hypothetical protein
MLSSGWSSSPKTGPAATSSSAQSPGWGNKPAGGPASGWGLHSALTNPFGPSTPASGSTAVPDFRAVFNLPTRPTFNFGTGETFTSAVAPTKSFIDPIIVDSITSQELPRARPMIQESDITTAEEAGVEQPTGEEHLDLLFEGRAGLWLLAKSENNPQGEWVDRGFGSLHFLRANGYYQMVIRYQDGHKVALNTRVFPGMQPKMIGKQNTSIRFCATVDKKLQVFRVRLLAEEAERLLTVWTKAIDDLAAGVVPVCERQTEASS